MNFKIESKTLNITNYPIIAEHFEAMAAKGWLIDKIIGRGIFIYKKIKPESLDFTIAPYEIETVFTKKTKKELEEFKTVCKNVGWNYVTQHFNLHIYYKEAGAEATPIQTDEEEEFKNIEEIGRKQIKASYVQIALFLVIAWMQLGRAFTTIYGMKDGISQIVGSAILLFLITEIIEVFRFKKFLNINRSNIEMGDSIEYKDSKFLIEKIISILYPILLILIILYIPFSGIALNNKIYLIALTPTVIGIIIAVLYRKFIKPISIPLKSKKIILVATLIGSSVLSIWIVILSVPNLEEEQSIGAIERLKVISTNDFANKKIEDDSTLRKNSSILVPKSYQYYSYARSDKYVNTEYADALNEVLARNLVDKYIKQAKSKVIARTSQELDISFEEGHYVTYLEYYGLKESDYNNLNKLDKREAIKMAEELMKERSITKDSKNLWNLDEVYFLSYDKKEIVLRNEKEVFYLEGIDLIEGKDFTDPEVIRIVKEKLSL